MPCRASSWEYVWDEFVGPGRGFAIDASVQRGSAGRPGEGRPNTDRLHREAGPDLRLRGVLVELVRLAALPRPGGVGLPVRDHLQLVREHVLRREELLRLAEVVDDLQVVGPALRVVVSPNLRLTQ